MSAYGMIANMICTLSVIGYTMYKSNKLAKSGITKNMDRWERLKFSFEKGAPTGMLLIILILIIALID